MKTISIFISLILFIGCSSKKENEETSISVVGVANLSVLPDIAQIQLSVDYSSVNLDSVLANVNKIVKGLLENLAACKAKPSSISTRDYNISFYEENKTKIRKYHGNQNIAIETVLSVAGVEEVINITRKYPGVGLTIGYSLSAKLKDSLAKKLRRMALKDAETKGTFLAKTSSLRIQRIKDINYGFSGYGGGNGAGPSLYEENGNSAPVNLVPQLLDLSDNVAVVYNAIRD